MTSDSPVLRERVLTPLDRAARALNRFIEAYNVWRISHRLKEHPELAKLEYAGQAIRVAYRRHMITSLTNDICEMMGEVDAPNYLEIEGMNSQGEVFTITVARSTGNPMGQIIAELKAQNTKLKSQVANLEEALAIHSYEDGEDDELEDRIEHDGLL